MVTNATPLENKDWEGNMGSLSMAGLLAVHAASVDVGANAAGTYTITEPETNRIVIRPSVSSSQGDIRVAVPNEGPADAGDFPVTKDAPPLMFRVTKGDVIPLFNDTGGSITVFFLECR